MILWTRTRRLVLLVAVLVGILAIGGMFGQRGFVAPTFFGAGGNGVLLATFLPLAWAAALADGFAARSQAVEARPVGLHRISVSRLGLLDTTLFVVAVAIAAASFSTIVVVSGPALAGVGPMLILSAVSCIRTLQAGPAHGALGASGLLILTTVYGPNAPAGSFVRVLQPDGNIAWSVACGVVLCGVAGWLLLTNRVTTNLGATQRLE